nr:class I SAM-dependent methyltransferase [uncultured Psychroserpens sp.]
MNLYEDNNFNYSEIFNKRGDDYHSAMKLIPSARDYEFNSLLNQVDIKDNMVIVDVPSGGNYLSKYLKNDVTVIPLETSEVFAKIGDSQICDWSTLPLKDNSADIIFCCAAFHHVVENDRRKFMNEASRVLKSNGKLVIADVKLGTSIDEFLNQFVDTYNSLGHNGEFMDDDFSNTYETSTLKADMTNFVEFPWVFTDSLEDSITYLKLMFGIDKADEVSILKEAKKILNFGKKEGHKNFSIDWALNYAVFKNQ